MSNQLRTYKILSLNLAGYLNWQSRERAIISHIDQLKPDVILFQEVHYDPGISLSDQATTLNNNLAKPYEFYSSSISRFYKSSSGKPRLEGLASLSRLPITESVTLALTKRPNDKHARIVQLLTFKTATIPLEIINIHLSNNSHSAEQFKEVYSLTKRYKRKPLIVGDFNIFTLSNYQSIYKTDYALSTDFKQYISFPSEGLTLDYLLLPKMYQFEAIDTVGSLSDHTAINYTFKKNIII